MYIQVDEDFPQHPKSVRLGNILGNVVAWAFMVRLWCWAAKYQQDGELGAFEPAEIDAAAGWPKPDGKFYAAAARVGFIEESEPGKPGRLHDWMSRTGADIARMRDAAERSRTRKKAWRERQGNADVTRDNDGTGTAQERLGDAEERAGNATRQDETSQVQARQDKQDPDRLSHSPPRGSVSGPDQTGTRSNSNADGPAILPPRTQHRIARVGTLTPAFLAVFDRYPRGDKRMEAAQIFAELADEYPGGEAALSAAILAAFNTGMLKRHPYHGPNATRPCFDTVLAERRWEDPPSAPDDAPPSAGRSKTDGNLHVARDFLAKQAVAK